MCLSLVFSEPLRIKTLNFPDLRIVGYFGSSQPNRLWSGKLPYISRMKNWKRQLHWIEQNYLFCALALLLLSRIARASKPQASPVSPEEAREEVLAVASDSGLVRAVAVLRQRTGLGLGEAHRTVTQWLEDSGTGRV